MDIVNSTQSTCSNTEACLEKEMAFFRRAWKIRKESKKEIKKGKERNKNVNYFELANMF